MSNMSTIFLFGDIKSKLLNKHEENAIKRGIVAAAKATGSWVCTFGAGLSKLVEDAKQFNPKELLDQVVVLTHTRWESLETLLKEKKGTCILVGGHMSLLHDVTKIADIVDKGQIIVVERAGRIADFLSYIYTTDDYSSLETEFKDSLITSEQTNSDGIGEKWQLLKSKITLWSPGDYNGLDTIIENLQLALLKGIDHDSNTHLRVSSSWDRYDLVEHDIPKMSEFLEQNRTIVKEHLIKGLIHNKVMFVSKLLRQYNDFEDSLTMADLYFIYKQSVEINKKDRAVDLFMNLLFPLEVVWPDNESLFFSQLGDLIESLLADTYLNPYSQYYGSDKKSEKENHEVTPCSKDLLCWALLLNRCEMAALFWTRGEHYTCSALFASGILRRLSKRAKSIGYANLAEKLKKNARIFESYAIAIMDKMQTTCGDIPQKLIVSVVQQYGSTTPLYIAGNNNLMDFMEQTSCQAKLNKIWNGHMAWNTSLLKKFMCIFLPFILLPTIKFKSSRTKDHNKTRPDTDEKNPRRYLTIFSSNKESRIGVGDAIYSFYSAPAIKFLTFVTFYVVYLLAFSIMVLTDLDEGALSFYEWFIYCWTATFILEEIRQVIEEEQPSARSKIKLWFSSAGNKFELVAYLMLLLSIGARILLPSSMFVWARYSYSITVIIFWWISMRFLFVHRHIGPKVVMIGKMLTDLVFLFLIFVVVIISVGIAYTANIYPNSTFNWATIKKIVFYPYWQMHGELFLDYIRGLEPDPPGDCTDNPVLINNGTLPACPVAFDMVTMISVVYLILLNIILVNVLIAMFSYTFMKVQSKAGKVARFHNYFLVREYSDMPTLVAPFNVINLLYRLCTRCCSNRDLEFKITLTDVDRQEMAYYETEALETSVLSKLVRNDFQLTLTMENNLHSDETV